MNKPNPDSQKKMLSIGFVLDDRLDKPDGVQQYVKHLGAWLSKRGHTVRYIVGHSPGYIGDPAVHHMSKTVKVRFNKNRMEIPLPVKKPAVLALFAAASFDILHVQLPYSPLLAARVVTSAPAHTSIVGTFHILPYARKEKIASRALALLIRRSKKRFARVFSVSKAAQLFARKTFGIGSKVLPNVVDMRTYAGAKPLHLEKKRKMILFLGRLVDRKGAQHALVAYRKLLELQPELAASTYLVIAGDGPLRSKLVSESEHIVERFPEAKIHFTGFIKEEDKPRYLAAATVALFPASGGESFGIVLIEAMAARSTVVLAGKNPGYASVMGSIPEALIDPHDTNYTAAVLLRCLFSNGFANKVHAKQQELVTRFDIETVGRELEEEYYAIVAAKQKRRHTTNK